MYEQTVNDFTPWADASIVPSRLSRGQVSPAAAVDEARPAVAKAAATRAEFSGAWPARALGWAVGLVRRIATRSEGDTRAELFAFAREIEDEAPNLAAELRFIANHRPDAPD